MSPLLLYLLVIATGSWMVWQGSEILERSAMQLSRYYGLPPVVHGGVVVAVGSSFPELSSMVLSTLLHGEFELGLSIVVGSAVFNILVIPGLSGIASESELRADKEVVYKDAQFYLISVAVLLLSFSFSVIYHPVEGETLVGVMTRPIALIPVLLYGLYLFVQQQEVKEEGRREEAPELNLAREWLSLGWSLLLIVVGVEGLLRSAIFLGDYFGMPSFIWGITVLAAVTSLPDTLVSVRLAKKGEGLVSLSNVLGSNIFDLLVAVPAGVLIAGGARMNFGLAVPLMASLTLATIILFTTLRRGLSLTKGESWVLLFVYLAFVLWILLEQQGLFDLINV